MSNKKTIKPITFAMGTVFTVSLATTAISSAAENPFSMKPVSGGYVMLAEGKCGAGKAVEGKCGMGRMDADADGNVSRDEFMQGHEAMFEKIDQNDDGVIDPAERAAHMAKMKGFMQEGKCGGSK